MMTENSENNGRDTTIEIIFEDLEKRDITINLTERDLKIQAFKDLVGERVTQMINFRTVKDEQLEGLLQIARQINATNRDSRDLIGQILKILGKEDTETGLEDLLYKDGKDIMDDLLGGEHEELGDPRLDALLQKKTMPKPVAEEDINLLWVEKPVEQDTITQVQYEDLVDGLEDDTRWKKYLTNFTNFFKQLFSYNN